MKSTVLVLALLVAPAALSAQEPPAIPADTPAR
jgi:hypothetical protein